MAKGFDYKGYEIYPAAQELGSGKWKPVVSVVKHGDAAGETLDQLFNAIDAEFDSEVDATAAAAQIGKNLVDGSQPGLNI